ncbi:glycosyltransferase [Candidatus Kaiserbacteria bacterium]|nr:glycosyltransferase [Candidatus Kaiserbacteria bacterium]
MRICYVNFNLKNPRDQITLRGLRENGAEIVEIADNTPGWRKYLNIARLFRASGRDCDAVMVGYVGGILVPFMKLLTRKPVFYNALCTFFDGMILSRLAGRKFSFASAWYFLLDLLAFHAAARSFVETTAQKEKVRRLYKVNRRKLSMDYVGTDDREFFYDASVPKLNQFSVVFRGMFLPEAGADIAVRAAKELESAGILIRILGRGLLLPEIEKLIRELALKNLELITERLPIEDLRRKMLECHLSLGQLAAHPRLETTIPHKAFESMSMKLPYLTAANRGVLEILQDNETCFTVPPGDYRALAAKIVELRDRPADLSRVAENAHALFLREYTPKILAGKMLSALKA